MRASRWLLRHVSWLHWLALYHQFTLLLKLSAAHTVMRIVIFISLHYRKPYYMHQLRA